MDMERIRKFLLLGLTITILLVSFTSFTSYALDYYWFGGTGNWEDPSNWNPSGIPSYADGVYLTNQPGSTATAFISSDIDNTGHLSLFGSGAGTMTLSLSGSPIFDVYGDGYIGNGGVMNQTSGDVVFYDFLDVGSGGIYNLSGGRAFAYLVNVYGELNQTGGRLDNDGMSVHGVYNLSGNGLVQDYYGYGAIGVAAGGIFNNSGGTVRGGPFIGVSHGGVFNQYSGSISTDSLGVSGVFNHYGGEVETGGDYFPFQRSITEQGIYNLSGGTLTANGNFTNDGTFNYSGGLFQLVGGDETLSNNGITNLSGPGTRTINGNVLNNGTFKINHTTAEYTGTFTNNGAYISDPATQYFNDLIVGNTGYFVGQHGDKFYISGDFINHSTMNTDWNTMHSYLSFISGLDNFHDLYLTALDYGALMSGYSDNFSWGVLDITGNILSLYDGNEIAGGALYLRGILGLDISGSLITNIFGTDGLNIYYMANLKGNDYLGGLVYDLSGGGHLIPVKTPEPSTMLLLGSGLIGLLWLRKKRAFG
jgi:hypothetical protein